MLDYNFHIERWDKYHCAQHVEPFLSQISSILQSYYKNNPIIFIDIGANVGKVYDLLYQKSILNIEKAYLFEGSERLYSYMTKKYNNNNKVLVFNDIILDEEIEINFDDDYVDYEIKEKNEYINYGLSEISPYNRI